MITEPLRVHLSAAMNGALSEAATVRELGKMEQVSLLTDVRAFATVTCGGWSVEQIQAWIEQVTNDLIDYPAGLVTEAVREARRRVWEPKRFLSWVHERIEENVAKLRTEIKMLETLTRLADQ